MTDTAVIEIALRMMTVTAKVAAPILHTSLAIGLALSLFQSVTQIQEVTLSFVPKAIGVGVAILLCGNWMLHELVSFTVQLYTQMPTILQTG
jgi:flagellar biosynthetic protein FliQ